MSSQLLEVILSRAVSPACGLQPRSISGIPSRSEPSRAIWPLNCGRGTHRAVRQFGNRPPSTLISAVTIYNGRKPGQGRSLIRFRSPAPTNAVEIPDVAGLFFAKKHHFYGQLSRFFAILSLFLARIVTLSLSMRLGDCVRSQICFERQTLNTN